MRKTLAVLLVSLVLFVANHPLSAQGNRWDSALDQYERICDECIVLRERAAAGGSVSSTAITSLLSRLADLRQSLQRAEGEMTLAQKERFSRIRDRYLPRKEARREPLAALPIVDRDFPVLASGPVSSFSPDRPFGSPDRSSISPGLSSGLHAPSYAPERSSISPPGPEHPRNQIFRNDFSFGVTAFASLPEAFPGLMFLAQWKTLGGYLKGTCSFSPGADYEAHSDGTSDSGLIWTTGEEYYRQFSISGGLVFSVNKTIGLYAGAGYGKQDIQWEDAAGKRARISDLSISGPQVDAGILLSLRHLLFQGGVVFREKGSLKFETGLGWRF